MRVSCYVENAIWNHIFFCRFNGQSKNNCTRNNMAIKQGANMQINQEQHGLQTILLDQKISRLQIHAENAEHDGTDISMEIYGYNCMYILRYVC